MDALAHLRSHAHGTLLADAHPFPVRYVIDPRASRVVMNVEPVVLTATEHTLHVPEESPADGLELELLLQTSSIDASDPIIDRWLAAHAPRDPLAVDAGKPPQTHWLGGTIETARFAGVVSGGLDIRNDLAISGVEAKIRRALNADRGLLATICTRRAGFEPVEPLCLGVDPDGIDIRAINATLPVRLHLGRNWHAALAPALDNLAAILTTGR